MMERTQAAALGFTVPTNADGSVTSGTVYISAENSGPLNSVQVANISAQFMHEMSEELGTVSGLPGNTPAIVDLMRYRLRPG